MTKADSQSETPGTPDSPETPEQDSPETPELEEVFIDESEATGDDELEALRKERDELNDLLLRTRADYQNYARRARQDVINAREQTVGELAKSLLPVIDHFDRALEVKDIDESAKSVVSGIEMVRAELIKTLGQYGVQPMEVNVGDEFDPNQHEALMRQEAEGLDSNHIAMVLQPGYVINERTLRPAQVCVTP